MVPVVREVFNIALEKRNLNKREVKRLVGNLHNHPRHLKALVNYMKEKQIAVQFEDNTIKWDEFTEFYGRLFDELVGISARDELGTAAANVPCFPLDEVRLIDERIQVSHLSKQDRQTNDLTRLHQILGTIFQSRDLGNIHDQTNFPGRDVEMLDEGKPGIIKVLFLSANPLDTSRLRLDQESRAIDVALRRSEFRDTFDIEQHWAVRVSDMQELLLRHKPDIVHFSGHGSTSSEIVLEDASGNSRPVSVRALSQLFSVLKDNIRCVVLNACYSEKQAQAIAQSIDCVIGMSKAIGDDAAISFAAAFYQALGFGRDFRTAFELGRIQIDLEGLDEQDVPKLLAERTSPGEIVLSK